MKYYVVHINDEQSKSCDWKKIAYFEFECIGQCDFEMEESEVDAILGDRAFSGGDIPEELIDEVIESKKENGHQLFFQKIKEAEGFVNAMSEISKKNILSIDEHDELDWNENWRKHYSAITIEGLITIVPSWEKEEADDQEILLYPGQGFGTGSHETTSLCLQELRDFKTSIGGRCLDFGCGSGVLGIVATKLFGCDVDYCDIDSNALDNCLQNLVLNFNKKELEGSSLILRNRFEIDEKYDLVFANILESILIKEQEIILNSLKKRGILIVSGILKGQEETIKKAYGNDMKLLNQSGKNDWASLVFEKL